MTFLSKKNMQGAPVFVYGTLSNPDVVQILLGRGRLASVFPRATLSGFSRRPVKNYVYPGMIPAVRNPDQHHVDGFLLNDLSLLELKLLDWFEGDEYDWKIVHVVIEDTGERIEAQTYIWKSHLIDELKLDEEWSYTTFCREHLQWYLEDTVWPCRKEMESLGMTDPRTVKFHRSDGVDGDHVLACLQAHPEVRKIRCEEVVTDEHVEAISRLLRNFHSAINLTSLELPRNGLTKDAGPPLAKILEAQHETLHKLDLTDNPLTHEVLGELLKPLMMEHPPSKLVHLNLTETRLGTQSAATSIALLLRLNHTIKSLYLGKNDLGFRGIKILAPELAKNPTLEVLDLSCNNIQLRGATKLAQILSSPNSKSNLRILDISSNNIGERGMHEMSKLLAAARRIEGFYAGCNNLGDVGAAALANLLKYDYNLTDLRLPDNHIGDKGAAMLSEALTKNETLEKLHLGWNGIGDEGAVALAEALKANSKLLQLDLTRNKLCCGGATALAYLLSYNHTLQELVLSYNRVGDRGAFAFAMAQGKPSCSLNKAIVLGNPITDEGMKALRRVPQLKLNRKLWLDQLIRDLVAGASNAVDLTSNCCIGNEEVLLLSEVLAQNNPLLKTLRLRGPKLSSRSLVPFFESSLPSPSNVVRLYIMHCACGEKISSALSQALRQNTSLEVLSLSNCSINARGAATIAEGLRKHTKLRRLNLDRNHIGDDGLNDLCQTLLPHKSMVALSVSRNGLTDKSMSFGGLKSLDELNMNGNEITDLGALDFCRSSMEGCKLTMVSLRQNKMTEKGVEAMKIFLPVLCYVDCK